MTKKMNPEAKAKIVEALRSGKYKQGRMFLRSEDCFCAWGVISDVSQQGAWVKDQFGDFAYDGKGYCVPTEAVQDWAGLVWMQDEVCIKDRTESLSVHNDNGATFEQLADAIEQQL